MTDRDLMQQALGALTRIWEDGLENYPVTAHESVMDALRERLARPEQDAVLAEREACAKVCDELWQEDGTAYDCRAAIRART